MIRESSPDMSDLARDSEEEPEERKGYLPPTEQYAKDEHNLHKKEFQKEVKSHYN